MPQGRKGPSVTWCGAGVGKSGTPGAQAISGQALLSQGETRMGRALASTRAETLATDDALGRSTLSSSASSSASSAMWMVRGGVGGGSPGPRAAGAAASPTRRRCGAGAPACGGVRARAAAASARATAAVGPAVRCSGRGAEAAWLPAAGAGPRALGVWLVAATAGGEPACAGGRGLRALCPSGRVERARGVAWAASLCLVRALADGPRSLCGGGVRLRPAGRRSAAGAGRPGAAGRREPGRGCAAPSEARGTASGGVPARLGPGVVAPELALDWSVRVARPARESLARAAASLLRRCCGRGLWASWPRPRWGAGGGAFSAAGLGRRWSRAAPGCAG